MNVFRPGELLKLSYLRYVQFISKREASGPAVKLASTLFWPNNNSSSAEATSREPLVILHGLLGSKTNWKSLAKTIADKTKRRVYTLDARNHGESPHNDDCSYEAMAVDLELFVKEQNFGSEIMLMGHSMGGKTAMLFAGNNPDTVRALVVVDVSPQFFQRDTSTNLALNSLLMASRKICPNSSLSEARKQLDKELALTIQSLSLRQFLLTNLIEENKKVRLRVNIEALVKHNSNFLTFSQGKGFLKQTLFICGGKSEYVTDKDVPVIRKLFPNVELNFIPDAGHWVHAEKPAEFLEALLPFLNKLK